MATKPAQKIVMPTVVYGSGAPVDVVGQFYKDTDSDILYEKVDGKWQEKTIIPKTLNGFNK